MLPTPPVGREADLEALKRALSEPGVVAVVGPPGVGTTRLLQELAADWQGEVVWGDLEGVRSVEGVVDRVATALGLREDGAASVGEALAGRAEALLVLDHGSAAASTLPGLVHRWARGGRVVVGSRVRVEGVRLRPLGPLEPEAARSLYRQRARSLVADRTFEDDAIDQLVAALDGLPLAIELAAARVRLYPPEVLRERLPGALAGLDAALALSWALLDEPTREALGALSTVRAVFTPDDFEAITGAGADRLEALLDASLVRLVEPGRMQLLQTVRRHTQEGLGAGELEAARSRHDRWVEARVAQALEAGAGTEIDRLRADLALAAERSPRAALLLARVRCERGPLEDPGPVPEGLEEPADWDLTRAEILGRMGRHEQALAVLDGVQPTTRSTRLRQATLRVLQWVQLRPAEALGGVPAIRAELGEGRQAAEGWLAIALARYFTGDRAGCREGLEAGRRALRGLHVPELEARLLSYLAILTRTEGFGVSAAHLERAAALYREHGNVRREAMARAWLGALVHEGGDLGRAEEALREAELLAGRAGDALLRSEIRGQLVDLGLERGALDEVEEWIAAIRSLPELPPVLEAQVRGREGLLALGRGEEGTARRALEQAIAGFEAHARSGLAARHRVFLALAGDPEREALLARAESASEEPADREAVARVRRALAGEAQAAPAEPGLFLRLALALVDPGVRVAADGSWLEPSAGIREALGHRPVLRRLLGALASAGPGVVVGMDALVETTWPGEKMRADSARGRLHASVRTLRKLGLDLETTELDGALAYRLAPTVRVVRA